MMTLPETSSSGRENKPETGPVLTLVFRVNKKTGRCVPQDKIQKLTPRPAEYIQKTHETFFFLAANISPSKP